MTPSPEQNAVIQHPIGQHARVLAVAGAGKTTTMSLRVRQLLDWNIAPARIRMVVYNRLARVDFQNKLHQMGLGHMADKVHTYHSLAFALWKSAPANLNPFSGWELISEDGGAWNTLARMACEQAEEIEGLESDSIPPETLLAELASWKGSLIGPDTADHPKEGLVSAFGQFEKLRMARKWLSFDDLILVALEILRRDQASQYQNKLEHLIVDEAQDINLAQKEMIRKIAGQKADLMLVGDDDQTIYSWRGSSPYFLLGTEIDGFAPKTWANYPLSLSYRIGPKIATMATALLRQNASVFPKQLQSAKTQDCNFKFWQGSYQYPSHKLMLEALLEWRNQKQSWSGVVVLGRLFSQLTDFESQLLRHRVPYRVEGAPKILERLPTLILRSYYELSQNLHSPKPELESALRMCINTPKRYLPRRIIDDMARQLGRHSLGAILREASKNPNLGHRQKQNIRDFLSELHNLEHKEQNASRVLNRLVKNLDLHGHLREQWGQGPAGDDQVASLRATLAYAHHLQLRLGEFFEHLQMLAQTETPKDSLLLTTIHRTKGLEWEMVVMPSCHEGLHPYLDKNSKKENPAQIIEERRLFYVAITRAKQTLWIGADPEQKSPAGHIWGEKPSRFLMEMQSPMI